MLAACPTHSVLTEGLMKFIVSRIDKPDVTLPPGELIYNEISAFGSSDSKNKS